MSFLHFAALGAAAYYFLDKEEGAHRREKAMKAFNELMDSLEGKGDREAGAEAAAKPFDPATRTTVDTTFDKPH